MCLIIAQYIIEPLESLNRSLQSVEMTVAGMMESTKAVKTQMQAMRSDAQFDLVFLKFEVKRKELDLEELILSRAKKPPAHIFGQAMAFHPTNV